MANDWVKSNRLELQGQSERFQRGIESLGSELMLTPTEISEFASSVTDYGDDMRAWVESKAATDALYETFMRDKETVVTLMRRYNKRMQSAAAITNAKRAEIGLPISDAASRVVPKKVTELIALPDADGTVKLKFNRSGNSRTVIFLVESSPDSVNWAFAANSTSTVVNLSGCTPGREKFFRVIATRGPLAATPSDPVVIYAGSGDFAVSLAA